MESGKPDHVNKWGPDNRITMKTEWLVKWTCNAEEIELQVPEVVPTASQVFVVLVLREVCIYYSDDINYFKTYSNNTQF